jgi:APA family basic amino acid/polyamine antiporter
MQQTTSNPANQSGVAGVGLTSQEISAGPAPVQLRRALSLPLLTLYGIGVTIGAGIYVLVGVTAARAGIYAPLTFVAAACVVAFTCLSYAELSTRYPVSAGEAEYLQRAFGSRLLAASVGLLLVTTGIVSSAAISIGAASYLKNFIALPEPYLVLGLVIVLALIATWGIVESITVAAVFTLIEVAGLAMVIWFGANSISDPSLLTKAFSPGMDMASWTGIAAGSLLAFFAFVGFEDIVNVAEEVEDPVWTLPRAILVTLVISTIAYLAVVTTMVAAVPLDVLAASKAPLALVFAGKSSIYSSLFNLIAVIATINGILIQMIMSSRVLYGLSVQGNLPAFFGYVHPRLRTPVLATLVVAFIVAILALTTPIARLAETTSQAVLLVFIAVNAALIGIKLRSGVSAAEHFETPLWVPFAGIATCALLLSTSFI